ncbi:MAG TPA: hypothetical protein VF834_20695 [Streptosporangiaceae bacterium]
MSTGVADGTAPPRSTDPVPVPSAGGRNWRRHIAVATAVVLAAALVTAGILSVRYQPIGFGGGIGYPAGPHLVSSQVNQTGGMQGQHYLPPQPVAYGSFQVSLANDGPLPVTIESLSLLPPGMPASAIRYGWPIQIDGQPTYTPDFPRLGPRPLAPRSLAGVVLEPGEYIEVRIPFRTARCWSPHSVREISGVWVTTKWLLWTHHVAISWTSPNDRSQGAILSEEGYASPGAAPGLICPVKA